MSDLSTVYNSLRSKWLLTIPFDAHTLLWHHHQHHTGRVQQGNGARRQRQRDRVRAKRSLLRDCYPVPGWIRTCLLLFSIDRTQRENADSLRAIPPLPINSFRPTTSPPHRNRSSSPKPARSGTSCSAYSIRPLVRHRHPAFGSSILMSTLAGLPGYSAPTQPHEGDKYSSGRLSMYFAEVGSCQVCPSPPTHSSPRASSY